MSVYSDILKEDIERVQRIAEQYRNRISEFPKGSIMVREFGNKRYIYLKYRENGKVIQEYVSCFDEKKCEELRNQINERKALEKEYKDLIMQEKDMKKALRALGEKNV